MKNIPACTFETLFDIFFGSTEIDLVQLNCSVGKQLIYSGTLNKSIKGLQMVFPSIDYKALVIPYGGVYINQSTGKLEIEVWNLEELEAAYLS